MSAPLAHAELRLIIAEVPDWTRASFYADVAAGEAERRSIRIRDALRKNAIGTARAHELLNLWTGIYYWMSGDPTISARAGYDWAMARGGSAEAGHRLLLDELIRARDIAMTKLQQEWGNRDRRPALELRARNLHALTARAAAMIADGKPNAEIDACANLRNPT